MEINSYDDLIIKLKQIEKSIEIFKNNLNQISIILSILKEVKEILPNEFKIYKFKISKFSYSYFNFGKREVNGWKTKSELKELIKELVKDLEVNKEILPPLNLILLM